MKKVILLAIAGMMCLGISAQEMNVVRNDMVKKVNKELSRKHVRYFDKATPLKSPSMMAKAAMAEEQEDTLFFYRSAGTFYGGVFSDGNNMSPSIISPANLPAESPCELWNYSYKYTDDMFAWVMGEDVLDTTVDFEFEKVFAEELEEGYIYSMPALCTLDTTQEDWPIVKSYSYGGPYAEEAHIWYGTIDEAGAPYPVPMTTCEMWTDTANYTYSPSDAGYDYWPAYAGYADEEEKYFLGEYIYGSNFNLGILEWAWGATRLRKDFYPDTIGVIFDNQVSMVVDSAFLPIYKWENVNNITDMIPDGATLKLDIYPITIDEEGYYIIDNKSAASATATNKDVSSFEAEEGMGLGVVNFVFKEKDPFGGLTPAPIQIDGMFFCAISGISSNNCDFGIMQDLWGGEVYTFYMYKGSPEGIMYSNIALSLNAYFGKLPVTGIKNVKADQQKAKKFLNKGQVKIQTKDIEYNILGLEK